MYVFIILIFQGGRNKSKCQVIHVKVYATKYVGHMQTNKQTSNDLATSSAALSWLQEQYQWLQEQQQQRNDSQKISAEVLCHRSHPRCSFVSLKWLQQACLAQRSRLLMDAFGKMNHPKTRVSKPRTWKLRLKPDTANLYLYEVEWKSAERLVKSQFLARYIHALKARSSTELPRIPKPHQSSQVP